MHLSDAELVRLELMIAADQVRSEPTALSETDRMMDAMNRAAQTKAKPRILPRPAASSSPDSHPAAGPQLNWSTPHTLEELILIRQELLRGEGATSR